MGRAIRADVHTRSAAAPCLPHARTLLPCCPPPRHRLPELTTPQLVPLIISMPRLITATTRAPAPAHQGPAGPSSVQGPGLGPAGAQQAAAAAAPASAPAVALVAVRLHEVDQAQGSRGLGGGASLDEGGLGEAGASSTAAWEAWEEARMDKERLQLHALQARARACRGAVRACGTIVACAVRYGLGHVGALRAAAIAA